MAKRREIESMLEVNTILLDGWINILIEKEGEPDLVCWLIQAKQYRNLELEFL